MIVEDHSCSSKMLPIKGLHATFHWCSTVPVCLSSIVSIFVTIYWSKISTFSILPTSVSFKALVRQIPLGTMVWKLVLKSWSTWTSWRWKPCNPTSICHHTVLSTCDGKMDRSCTTYAWSHAL